VRRVNEYGRDGYKRDDSRPAQLEHKLQARPSLEAAQTEYQAAVQNMATSIAALTPGTTRTIEKNTWGSPTAG
jgi:hypothetical protein